MNKTAILLLLCVFSFSLVSVAQDKKMKSGTHSMTGYLVDKMCATGMAKKDSAEAMAKAEKHTKSCALEDECQASGYGLMSEGKWYKFDDKGDKLALEWLNKTTEKNHLLVEVTGTHDGDIFKVKSLKGLKAAGSEMEMKKDSKQDDMKMDNMKKD
ncbi:MAG TPA: hypothetical protein VMM58_08075 [Bacteroidota bacterium]|nr:hypothetical protein [Bacteroidota bacterium]